MLVGGVVKDKICVVIKKLLILRKKRGLVIEKFCISVVIEKFLVWYCW